MKSNIFKSLGVILILIVLGLIYNLTDYQVSQSYSQVASQQVNDDTAYYVLHSQSSLIYLYKYIFGIITVVVLSLFYFIWKPKK